MSLTRRVRGWLLRLVRRRPAAIAVGALLAAPGAWLLLAHYRWEAWYTQAAGLVLASTGAAFVLAGLGGRRPDWVDPDEPGRS